MKIVKYFLITDPNTENSNPGDILIGKGIEYNIREAEKKLGNQPIISYVSIFNQNPIVWDRVYSEADMLIICGTPQLNKTGGDDRWQWIYSNVQKASRQGIVVANLWMGSGYTGVKVSKDVMVETMLEANEENLLMFECFDLIITRDSITTEIVKKAGFEVTQLIDSVTYSIDYFNQKNEGEQINLLVLRRGDFDETTYKSFQEVEKVLEKNKPTYYFCHTVEDYLAYVRMIPKEKLLCANNPKDLLAIYARANQVVSLRIHGSVPSLTLGKRVVNIGMDSRTNILDYIGCPSVPIAIFREGGTDWVKFYQTDVTKLKAQDKERFQKLFYEKCQRRMK